MKRKPEYFVDSDFRFRQWLFRPTHWWQTTIAIGAGGALYGWLVDLTGGYQSGDAEVSMYSSLMIAHGHWSCAYPPTGSSGPLSGPVYPLVSAFVQWVTHTGFSAPFLSSAQLEASCHGALSSFTNWANNSDTLLSILPIATVAWFALCISGVALVGSTQLRRTRFTWLVPFSFAVSPPILLAVQESYHPQDQWALAMMLAALALWLRHRVYSSAVFAAIAFMSQQYTILGVIMLMVVLDAYDRRQFIFAVSLTTILVAMPMYFVAGHGALSAIFIGTGETVIHPGTWMAELHVSSGVGLAFSRLGPPLTTILLSLWCLSRRPNMRSEPVIILGLLATCWSIRLVFEENLWGYYCLATGATLVLRDIVASRFSRATVGWLVLVLFAFDDIRHNPTPWTSWPTWVWQLLIVPSAFLISFLTLRRSMQSPVPLVPSRPE